MLGLLGFAVAVTIDIIREDNIDSVLKVKFLMMQVKSKMEHMKNQIQTIASENKEDRKQRAKEMVLKIKEHIPQSL